MISNSDNADTEYEPCGRGHPAARAALEQRRTAVGPGKMPAATALAPQPHCEIPSNDKATDDMKTSYELAMERLSKAAPTVTLTAEQKAEIADLESRCAAKIAERELLLNGEISKAIDRGDGEAIGQLEKQLLSDRKSLRAEFEEKKDKVRQRPAK
jgi:hypothetical protein